MPRGDLCAASMVCEVHKPEKLDSTNRIKGPTQLDSTNCSLNVSLQQIQVAGRVRPRHLILLPCLLRKIAANLVLAKLAVQSLSSVRPVTSPFLH